MKSGFFAISQHSLPACVPSPPLFLLSATFTTHWRVVTLLCEESSLFGLKNPRFPTVLASLLQLSAGPLQLHTARLTECRWLLHPWSRTATRLLLLNAPHKPADTVFGSVLSALSPARSSPSASASASPSFSTAAGRFPGPDALHLPVPPLQIWQHPDLWLGGRLAAMWEQILEEANN
eukprot:657100-Rhodomonas_salina.1